MVFGDIRAGIAAGDLGVGGWRDGKPEVFQLTNLEERKMKEYRLSDLVNVNTLKAVLCGNCQHFEKPMKQWSRCRKKGRRVLEGQICSDFELAERLKGILSERVKKERVQ